MQLKDVIESPCGLRYMFDQLDLQSSFGRRSLLDMPMMKNASEIGKCYAVLKSFHDFVLEPENTPYINTLQSKLQCLKDVRTTIKHLGESVVLDDIELFEVKHLAILTADISERLHKFGLDKVIALPDMQNVISILDPDGLKIATFYIYDSYSEDLKELRAQIRKNAEMQEELLFKANEIEDRIRLELSRKLRPFVTEIEQAQQALALIDINLAKALQMKQLGLIFPSVSKGTTSYEGLFHPQVKESLAAVGKLYQPVDISFDQQPTLITGANMGGKTVVLKTLTLCQYLFQFGFGIPAEKAEIDVRDEIYFCIGDEQSIEKGLSSFAAEMKNIDAVIKASRKEGNIVAMVDEPARTTNPKEGAALVTALIELLSGKNVSLVLTTHYDIESASSKRLRVKGFVDGQMNYQLVEVKEGEVPHEALNIAESLGIDCEWIALAKKVVEFDHFKQRRINKRSH